MKSLQIHTLFDKPSSTLTYIVWDGVTGDAVVIDPVLDYDSATQMTSERTVREIDAFVKSKGLHVWWVLETHAHADHLSGSRALKKLWPGVQWGLGSAMNQVFTTFKKVLAWPESVQLSHLGVDRWLGDGEEFSAGSLRISAVATPGHTPACVTYKIGEWLFTGDALMMPDSGTGRCDFPGGSASALYDSIWGKLYTLPEHYRVYVGHDYQPGGRHLRYQSTIGEEKAENIHLRQSTSKPEFVAFREGRDKTLSAPKLLEPSLDWNLGAHQLVK